MAVLRLMTSSNLVGCSTAVLYPAAELYAAGIRTRKREKPDLSASAVLPLTPGPRNRNNDDAASALRHCARRARLRPSQAETDFEKSRRWPPALPGSLPSRWTGPIRPITGTDATGCLQRRVLGLSASAGRPDLQQQRPLGPAADRTRNDLLIEHRGPAHFRDGIEQARGVHSELGSGARCADSAPMLAQELCQTSGVGLGLRGCSGLGIGHAVSVCVPR